MTPLIRQLNAVFAHIPYDIVALALRIFPAMVFFQSGRTKVEGWFTIKDSTWFLFREEYALPLIPSDIAAVMGTVAEHALPVLIIAGLFTRFAALGLLIMTATIQIFVYPDAWITHGLWGSTFLALIALGPGRLSVDSLLGLDGPVTGQTAPRFTP